MRAVGSTVNHRRGAGRGREKAVGPRWRRGLGRGRGAAGAGGRWDADPAPCCCHSAPGVGSRGARNMAAAVLSFGPEREAEPAKEARVVGSELVDTYTVCWGTRAPKAGLAPGTRIQIGVSEEGSGSHIR